MRHLYLYRYTILHTQTPYFTIATHHAPHTLPCHTIHLYIHIQYTLPPYTSSSLSTSRTLHRTPHTPHAPLYPARPTIPRTLYRTPHTSRHLSLLHRFPLKSVENDVIFTFSSAILESDSILAEVFCAF